MAINEIGFPLPFAQIDIVGQEWLQSFRSSLADEAIHRGLRPAGDEVLHYRLVSLQMGFYVQIVDLDIVVTENLQV